MAIHAPIPRHQLKARAVPVPTRGAAFLAAVLAALSLALIGCTGFIVPPPEEPAPGTRQVSPANLASAADLTAKAQTHFQASQFQEAESAFLAALEADPGNIPALTGLSHYYTYFPERWQEALNYAERAQEIAPEDATVLAHLAWAQQLAHYFEDAIVNAAAAVEADPENPLAQLAEADLALSLYEPERALHHINKALALEPDNVLGLVLLSMVQEALHDWPAAEAAAVRAVELAPEFHLWKIVESRRNFDLQGDPITALEIAQDALTALPDHPYVLGLEVDMAVELNDWDRALSGCEQMATLHTADTPYPDGYTCLANVSMLMEDYPAARKFQDQAEEAAWPARLDISMTRMFLLNNAEECQQSRELAGKWLRIRPYSMAAQRMMGVGYMCSEEFQEAIPYLRTVSEKLPASVTDARLLAISFARNEEKSEAARTLADIKGLAFNDPLYYQAQYELNFILGDLEASIDNAQRWSVLRPYSSDAYEAVAFAHLYNGDLDAAQRAALNAFEQGSTTSTVMGILGYADLLTGKLVEAEEKLKESVDKDPDMFLTRYSLSQLFLHTDRCEEGSSHITWLAEQADTPEAKADYEAELAQCFELREQDEESQIELTSVVEARAAAEEEYTRQDIGLRFFRVMERAGQKALIVLVSSSETPGTVKFQREEIGAAMFASTLLPKLDELPDTLILVSEHEGQRISMVVVRRAAALLWLNQQISTEQFVASWRREDASNMPADIFADLE